MDNIAEHLRSARKSKGWTQKEAAASLEISERQYQKYERDLMPPWDVLQKIEEIMGVSVIGVSNELKGRKRTIRISQRHLIL